MKRLAFAITAFALLLAHVGANQGQSKPNFSGTWSLVLDPQAPGAGGLGGPVGRGFEFAAVQDDKTLTITTTKLRSSTMPSNGPKSSYNLDGSESSGDFFVEKVKFDGAKLVITRPPQPPDKYSETWSLESPERLMIQLTNYALANPNKVAVYKKVQ